MGAVKRLLGVLLLVPVALAAGGGEPRARAAGTCAPRRASAAQTARIRQALSSGRDVWGERLLHAPGGPTYDAVRRLLPPLLYARAHGGRPLTDSGVYY